MEAGCSNERFPDAQQGDQGVTQSLCLAATDVAHAEGVTGAAESSWGFLSRPLGYFHGKLNKI
jgi:hypothetical protein